MSEDRCVCCGEVIPEGGHVCIQCMAKIQKKGCKAVFPTYKKRRKELDKAAKELKESYLDLDIKTFD